MADPRGARGQYGTYADVLPGGWQDYLLLEAAASRVLAYEAQRIPALLQTPDYARALAEADPGLADEDARDRAVEATLARQNVILGERKPDVHVIIGEAALHQEVGGAEVMEGQLGLLAGVSGDSGVITVQILPFSSGAHAASDVGSLAILQFPEALGLGVVHLGGAGGGVCLEGDEDHAIHTRVFEQLRAFALSPAQSALLLRGQVGRVRPHDACAAVYRDGSAGLRVACQLATRTSSRCSASRPALSSNVTKQGVNCAHFYPLICSGGQALASR